MTLARRQLPAIVLLTSLALVSIPLARSPVGLDLSVLVAINSLLALSIGIAYGQAGILSIAQASFAALGAYATAIVTTRYQLSPYIGLPASIFVPCVLAYPVGRLVTGLSPLALSLATLLLGQVIDIAIREGDSFTGGYIGLSGIPQIPIATTLTRFHFLAWGAVLLVVVLYSNLLASPVARAANTIRRDALRAAADGVSVPHVLSGVFVFSAAVAGLAGWLYAHHLTYIGPESLSTGVSLSTLLMAVVGGVRFVLGPVIGAAILTIALNYLPAQEVQGLFYGTTLIIILLIAPDGVLNILFSRWRSAGNSSRPATLPTSQDSAPIRV
jgi:branched-chain amino acid transport system permease protein